MSCLLIGLHILDASRLANTAEGGDWESLLPIFLNCQTQPAGVGVILQVSFLCGCHREMRCLAYRIVRQVYFELSPLIMLLV